MCTYLCACVCACVRICVHVCVHVHVWFFGGCGYLEVWLSEEVWLTEALKVAKVPGFDSRWTEEVWLEVWLCDDPTMRVYQVGGTPHMQGMAHLCRLISYEMC